MIGGAADAFLEEGPKRDVVEHRGNLVDTTSSGDSGHSKTHTELVLGPGCLGMEAAEALLVQLQFGAVNLEVLLDVEFLGLDNFRPG